MNKKLGTGFYRRDDVLQIARELLGKVLVTRWEGKYTAGRIVECEAYAGIADRAAHSFGGRRTGRTEIMYAPGGYAYVYLCYGIHEMFNIVTNARDIPQAILLRALEPLEGVAVMLERAGKQKADHTLTRGPGNLSKALGIRIRHNGLSLSGNEIYLTDDGFRYAEEAIRTSPRIGVAYAAEDALLPYRFYVKDNPYVSAKPR